MEKQKKTYNTYTREFKLEALRQMEESDGSATELSRALGLRPNQLYKWRDQMIRQGDKAFMNKKGRPLKEDQQEVTTLKQENKRLKEEVYILKKAAAYFAKELK